MSRKKKTVNPTEVAAQAAQDSTLQALAKEIQGHHAKYGKSLRSSLIIARQAGEALLKAKEIVQDRKDSWKQWVKDNCKIEMRQVQKYLKIAKGWNDLVQQGRDPDALSINEADRLLSNPGSKPPRPSESKDKDGTTETEPSFRLTRTDLSLKKHEAKRLQASAQIRFTEETPEGKLLRQTLKALADKLRKEVKKLAAGRDTTDPVQEAHLLIALTEQLSLELQPEAIFEIAEPENASPASPAAVKDKAPPPAVVEANDKDQSLPPAEQTNRVKEYLTGNGKHAQVA